MEDRDLMARIAGRRDRRAAAKLIGRWDQRVFAYLVKASGDVEAAKDLRQEVFMRVYRYAASYDPEYAFSTWLFRIAGNVLRTWYVKQERLRAVEQAASDRLETLNVVSLGRNPRQQAIQHEEAERVRAAIDRLPLEDRELLLLRMDQEFSYREIAELRGAPESTVKSRFYTILRRLREGLAESAQSERRLQP